MDALQFVNNCGETLEQGDVIVLGDRSTSLFFGLNTDLPIPEIDLTDHAYDTHVCGIVSEVHAELRNDEAVAENSMDGAKKKKTKGKKPQKQEITVKQIYTQAEMEQLDRSKVESGQMGWMITSGLFAYCKADADIAPIQVGDLLTTSPTKGHAQKALDPTLAVGAILGKAMGTLKKGKGKIPVLVMLH